MSTTNLFGEHQPHSGFGGRSASGAKKSSRGGSNELAMKNVAWKK